MDSTKSRRRVQLTKHTVEQLEAELDERLLGTIRAAWEGTREAKRSVIESGPVRNDLTIMIALHDLAMRSIETQEELHRLAVTVTSQPGTSAAFDTANQIIEVVRHLMAAVAVAYHDKCAEPGEPLEGSVMNMAAELAKAGALARTKNDREAGAAMYMALVGMQRAFESLPIKELANVIGVLEYKRLSDRKEAQGESDEAKKPKTNELPTQ